jgi:hypothetical protein
MPFGPVRRRLYAITTQRFRAMERLIGDIEQRAKIRGPIVRNRNPDADG